MIGCRFYYLWEKGFLCREIIGWSWVVLGWNGSFLEGGNMDWIYIKRIRSVECNGWWDFSLMCKFWVSFCFEE